MGNTNTTNINDTPTTSVFEDLFASHEEKLLLKDLQNPELFCSKSEGTLLGSVDAWNRLVPSLDQKLILEKLLDQRYRHIIVNLANLHNSKYQRVRTASLELIARILIGSQSYIDMSLDLKGIDRIAREEKSGTLIDILVLSCKYPIVLVKFCISQEQTVAYTAAILCAIVFHRTLTVDVALAGILMDGLITNLYAESRSLVSASSYAIYEIVSCSETCDIIEHLDNSSFAFIISLLKSGEPDFQFIFSSILKKGLNDSPTVIPELFTNMDPIPHPAEVPQLIYLLELIDHIIESNTWQKKSQQQETLANIIDIVYCVECDGNDMHREILQKHQLTKLALGWARLIFSACEAETDVYKNITKLLLRLAELKKNLQILLQEGSVLILGNLVKATLYSVDLFDRFRKPGLPKYSSFTSRFLVDLALLLTELGEVNRDMQSLEKILAAVMVPAIESAMRVRMSVEWNTENQRKLFAFRCMVIGNALEAMSYLLFRPNMVKLFTQDAAIVTKVAEHTYEKLCAWTESSRTTENDESWMLIGGMLYSNFCMCCCVCSLWFLHPGNASAGIEQEMKKLLHFPLDRIDAVNFPPEIFFNLGGGVHMTTHNVALDLARLHMAIGVRMSSIWSHSVISNNLAIDSVQFAISIIEEYSWNENLSTLAVSLIALVMYHADWTSLWSNLESERVTSSQSMLGSTSWGWNCTLIDTVLTPMLRELAPHRNSGEVKKLLYSRWAKLTDILRILLNITGTANDDRRFDLRVQFKFRDCSKPELESVRFGTDHTCAVAVRRGHPQHASAGLSKVSRDSQWGVRFLSEKDSIEVSTLGRASSGTTENGWTLSFWSKRVDVASELQRPNTIHTLVCTSNGDQLVAVLEIGNALELGCVSGSTREWYGCGVDLNQLEPGWHHFVFLSNGRSTKVIVDRSLQGNPIEWGCISCDIAVIGNSLSYSTPFCSDYIVADLRYYATELPLTYVFESPARNRFNRRPWEVGNSWMLPHDFARNQLMTSVFDSLVDLMDCGVAEVEYLVAQLLSNILASCDAAPRRAIIGGVFQKMIKYAHPGVKKPDHSNNAFSSEIVNRTRNVYRVTLSTL